MHRHFLFSIPVFLVLAFLLLTLLSSSEAAQIRVADMTVTMDRWYYQKQMPDNPNNWQLPHNYAQGDCYFRMEVKSYPGNPKAFMVQPCFFQDQHTSEKHACFWRQGGDFTFDKVETRYRKFSMNWKGDMYTEKGLWQYGVIDWSRRLLDFMIIDNQCEQGCKTGVVIRFEAIVVEKGGTLAPPEHWECPAEWNAGDPPPPPPTQPKFISSGTEKALVGQTFAYRFRYDTTGCRCKPGVRYAQKPIWLNSMGDSVFGVPTQAGVDTVVAVLEVEKQPVDTLQLLVSIDQGTRVLALPTAVLRMDLVVVRSHAVHFAVYSKGPQDIAVEIRDIAGKLVWRKGWHCGASRTVVEWQPKAMTPGLFVVTLQSGKQRVSQKVFWTDW